MDELPDWVSEGNRSAVLNKKPAAEPTLDPDQTPDWVSPQTKAKLPTVSRPFKDQDFAEYSRLVMSKDTTPEQLSSWMESKGYGKPINVPQILAFHKANPTVKPSNSFTSHNDPLAAATGDPEKVTSLGEARQNEEPQKWGLDPETMKALGYEDYLAEGIDPASRVARFLKDIPASTLNALYTALQAGGYAVDKIAEGADKAYEGSELDKAIAGITGVHQRPSEIIGGLLEAFPLGGAEVGGFRPGTGDLLARPAERLAEQGIKVSDLPPGVTPRQAVAALEEAKGLQEEARNFKPKPEPKPTDVFPTEASRADDAEAWGKSLGAPEPAPVEAPTTVAGEAAVEGISKRETNKLFKEATKKPETQTTAEWEKGLQAQADEFLNKSKAEEVPSEPAPNQTKPVVNPTEELVTPEATPTGPTAVEKLTAALRTAGAAREEQNQMYTEARREKLAKLAEAQKSGKGKEAYEQSLAALKGELPKADFEEVGSKMSQADIDELYNSITKTETLSPYGKMSAYTGLTDILRGKVPTPKSLEHLREVFPDDFIKTALSKRSRMQKTLGAFGEVWNAPKSLMSTVDLSAPLRQGIGLAHRGEYWKSFGKMFHQAVSQKAFEKIAETIKTHPNYALAEEAGLSITNVGGKGSAEEAFASHLAEKIPGYGKLVQGSERAYVGFLNKLRFDTFNSLVAEAKGAGIDIDSNPEAAKAIANYINIMTGRGGLGKAGPAADVLNSMFFSPRMISSRVQILTAPVTSVGGKGFIADLPAPLRKEAAKSYTSIVGMWMATLGITAAGGASINTNITSSDFGKAVDGKIHLDPGAGFSQFIVAGSRALLRKSTSTSNGETRNLTKQGDTPLDSDLKFIFNKMHPSLSLFVDQQRGKNAIGEPFKWGPALIQRLTPMGIPDVVNALKEEPNNKGLYYGVLGLLGMSLSVYDPKAPREKPTDGATSEVAQPEPVPVSIPESEPMPDWVKQRI